MRRVIFACVHNAGRSQIAAAWFNEFADPALAQAESAGTQPGDRVHPEVLGAMREVGIDLQNARPQRLTDAVAQDAALLVTMGCTDECPVVPGAQRDDWPLEDPKGKPMARVREIRDEIRARVVNLIAAQGWGRTSASVLIRAAQPSDREGVEALLRAETLPLAGVAENFGNFFIAERCGAIVGAAGLEFYAEFALLRSVVVAPDARRERVAGRLTEYALRQAQRRQMCCVYLLTTTAQAYFARRGFDVVDRANVPARVKRSREFADACPASAIVMHTRLENPLP